MKLGGYHEGSRGFWSSTLRRPRTNRGSGGSISEHHSAGFTIVETLVVLAVTGGLFIAIAATMTGRQARTQFTTAIHSAQQQLQQIINETSTGYYPNGGNFSCNGTSPVTLTTNSSKDQGTNGGCLFMGKAVQFGLGSGDAASQLGVLPLVGDQYMPSTLDPVLTVSAAKPRAIYPDGASENRVPTTAATTLQLEGGLTTASLTYMHAGSPVSAGAIAFVTGDSSGTITALEGSQGTNLKPGSLQLSLYGVRTSTINPAGGLMAASRSIGNTTTNAASNNLEPATSAAICLASGTTQQSGLLTVSAGLQVTLAIKDGLVC